MAIKNQPFRHKKPLGWRPGVGKVGTTHPSIVRDGNPAVRAKLRYALLQLKHTHAIFQANPDCCPICCTLDGRRQRIGTVLRWKYALPHANCRCTWTTEKVMKGNISSPMDLVQTKNTVHVFTKGTIAGRPGLHKEKRPLKRGGTVTKWVRDAAKQAGEKVKRGAEQVAEKTKGAATTVAHKLEGSAKSVMNAIVGQLRKINPGSSQEVNGVKVERHADGSTFRVGGIVFQGFRAASLGVAGYERAMASAGQFGTGSLAAGAEMSHGGQMTKDVATAQSETSKLASQIDSFMQQHNISKKKKMEVTHKGEETDKPTKGTKSGASKEEKQKGADSDRTPNKGKDFFEKKEKERQAYREEVEKTAKKAKAGLEHLNYWELKDYAKQNGVQVYKEGGKLKSHLELVKDVVKQK